ncbi:MAG: hypothetical protein QXP81_08625 [Nitrososphaerota archaeon]
MKGAKEKVLDALRTAARGALELVATYTPRLAAYLPIVVYEVAGAGGGNQGGGTANFKGLADALSGNLTGSLYLLAAVGGVLLLGGALLRFLPGISADLRQTAIRMIEGGVLLLALGGTGALILGGGYWIGQQIANTFGFKNANQAPTDYLNPWRP